MIVKTSAGTIALTEKTATITRRAFFGAAEESRVVRLDELTGLDYRAATALGPGHLKLLHSGNASTTLKLREHDRDTIMFTLPETDRIRPLRAHLMEAITGEPFTENEDEKTDGRGVALAFQAAIALSVIGWFVWMSIK